MKNDFTQWKNDYGLEFEPNYSKDTELDCMAAFKAGQQSKQDEVDDLQYRIDEALKLLNLAYPESWGYCVDEAINILKGG